MQRHHPQAPFDVTVRAAADAGFRGISLYYDEYRRLAPRGGATWTLGLHGRPRHLWPARRPDGWLPGDTGAPSAAEFVAAAAALAARSITVFEVRGRRVGDTLTFEDAASAFAAVCDRAADRDLLAHVEYFPQSGIPDLRTAYEIVGRRGEATAG